MQRDATQPASGGWRWTGDASAFVGFNYQAREFRDFHAWESQNWLMGEGTHPHFEAYLFEATIKASTRGMVFTRAEAVDKDILDAGFHPRGVFHRHRHSQVGAVTVGYVFNFLQKKAGTFGAGADITRYSVPLNLKEPYGSPSSFHFFLHYSLRGQGVMHH